MQSRWLWALVLQFLVIPPAFGELAGIQITAPEKGAVVRPGALLKMKVDTLQGLPVSQVTYVLLEEDRALEDKVEPPPSTLVEIAPFEAEITVPQEGVGPHRLLAISRIRERRGFYVLFDETAINVDAGGAADCSSGPVAAPIYQHDRGSADAFGPRCLCRSHCSRSHIVRHRHDLSFQQ